MPPELIKRFDDWTNNALKDSDFKHGMWINLYEVVLIKFLLINKLINYSYIFFFVFSFFSDCKIKFNKISVRII